MSGEGKRQRWQAPGREGLYTLLLVLAIGTLWFSVIPPEPPAAEQYPANPHFDPFMRRLLAEERDDTAIASRDAMPLHDSLLAPPRCISNNP